MSLTDFERNDDLDGLTSEELEARAFGPDPAARRSGLSRFARRPSFPARVARPPRPARRLLAGVALAAVLAGVGVYSLVTDVHHGDHGHYDWVELDTGDYGWAEHDAEHEWVEDVADDVVILDDEPVELDVHEGDLIVLDDEPVELSF